MKRSRGTVIPADLRLRVLERDQGCVGFGRFPGACGSPLEFDHVRSSGALGKKTRTTEDNLCVLCRNHHRFKTENGRYARPILLDYLSRFYPVELAEVLR